MMKLAQSPRRPFLRMVLGLGLMGLSQVTLSQTSKISIDWSQQKSEPVPMDSVADFKCNDITPGPGGGLDIEIYWNDQAKRLDMFNAWEATYSALSVQGKTNLQTQTIEHNGKTYQSDPSALSIYAKIRKITKPTPEFDRGTILLSVAQSNMPADNNYRFSWIATASLRLNQDERMEKSPDKPLIRMTLLFKCNFLSPTEKSKRDAILLQEKLEEEARQELRGIFSALPSSKP